MELVEVEGDPAELLAAPEAQAEPEAWAVAGVVAEVQVQSLQVLQFKDKAAVLEAVAATASFRSSHIDKSHA